MAITSGQQGQSSSATGGTSRHFIFAFIATLVLIVGATLALSLRVWLHRRRLRRLLYDAAAEGAGHERFLQMARDRNVVVPPPILALMGVPVEGTWAGRPGRRARKEVKLGRTPTMWESRLEADDGAVVVEKAAGLERQLAAWQPLFVSLPASKSTPTTAPYTPLVPPPSPLHSFLVRAGLAARPPAPASPPAALARPTPTAGGSTNAGPHTDEKLALLLSEAAAAATNEAEPPVLVGVFIRPPEDPVVRSARLARQRAAAAAAAADGVSDDDDDEPLVEVELGWMRVGLDAPVDGGLPL